MNNTHTPLQSKWEKVDNILALMEHGDTVALLRYITEEQLGLDFLEMALEEYDNTILEDTKEEALSGEIRYTKQDMVDALSYFGGFINKPDYE
jgi:hypothetical protein